MFVRTATEADRPELLRLAEAFRTEYPHATRADYDLGPVVDYILRTGTFLVLDDAGDLAGMLGIVVGPHPLTGVHTALEHCWYISDSHRSGICGARLLAAGERYARDHGAVQLQMGSPSDRVSAFLERIGYKSVEVTYAKELTY